MNWRQPRDFFGEDEPKVRVNDRCQWFEILDANRWWMIVHGADVVDGY